MSKKKNYNVERIKDSINNNPEKEINELAYTFLKKYSEKKSVIDKLMSFKTSKWLEYFKNQLDILKKEWKIDKRIKVEELFQAIKEVKNKIHTLSKKNIEELKASLNNKEFSPNQKYDLAEQFKITNPELYKIVTNPTTIKQHFISAWYWIWNSIYKTWAWAKNLWKDFLKLVTFQVPLEQIKEQFKKV